MINVDLRLKVRHFFKKYKKIIFICVAIWAAVFIVNAYLKKARTTQAPTTTYEPNVAVLNSSSKVPKKVANSFEEFIEKYVNACNTADYKEAYNLISEDCKKNFFENDYENFVRYVRNKFYAKRSYVIQNYSNYNDKYIYSVKLFDDFLATGLTNSDYQYQEEFMIASYDENKNIVFSVGNYVESKPLSSVASNNYLKVNLKSVVVKYSHELYEIKIANRTDNTIVIQNGNTDNDEVELLVDGEYRGTTNYDIEIVLGPKEERTITLAFPKFYDSNTTSDMIVLSAVRVMENYTGTEVSEEEELEKTREKFSMNIPIE